MKTYKCDQCRKQIDESSQVFVCDNYDSGYPFIFCSMSCFEKFQNLRIYKTLADAMKEEDWIYCVCKEKDNEN